MKKTSGGFRIGQFLGGLLVFGLTVALTLWAGQWMYESVQRRLPFADVVVERCTERGPVHVATLIWRRLADEDVRVASSLDLCGD